VTFQHLQERITGPAAVIVEAGDLLDEVVKREKENAVQPS
jgi:HAE1 family hydrophobic/amphiphilic exporter-1